MKNSSISRDLFEKIKMDRQLILSIHSVYCDVINTVDPNKTLISFLNHGKRLVPMGMIIEDELEFQNLKKYTKLTIDFTDKSTIRLNAGVEVTDLYIYSHTQNIKKVISVQSILKEFLKRNAPIDSFYTIIHQFINEDAINCNYLWDSNSRAIIIPKLKIYLQALSQNSCIDNKLNVFGFGRGLTPSSDDFILGISAVFQYIGDLRLNAIKNHGEKFLETTTYISSQMLKNAWNGQYNMYLHKLFQAIEEDEVSEEILLDIISYGHTSGIDTLCGIIMGIEILKNDEITF